MKFKTQIAVATLAVAASTLLVWSAPGEDHTPTIEGVWQVTRVGVNCNDPNQAVQSPFPALMTFHRDGTTSGAAKSPVTGPFDTPEFGSWQRAQGSQNYSFREVSYKYDGNGTFVAVGDNGAIITSPDGASWTSRHNFTEYENLQDVTYGNGTFVAVGTNSESYPVGVVLTSPERLQHVRDALGDAVTSAAVELARSAQGRPRAQTVLAETPRPSELLGAIHVAERARADQLAQHVALGDHAPDVRVGQPRPAHAAELRVGRERLAAAGAALQPGYQLVQSLGVEPPPEAGNC